MTLTAGTRLRSIVCDTQVIVIRSPAADFVLCCGGAPMVLLTDTLDSPGIPAQGWDEGSLLGKRYVTDDGELEVLVTRAGTGTLGDGKSALAVKASKPLPSSD